MATITALQLLKFASCISNNKDIRAFCHIIFVDRKSDQLIIQNTNGAVAIRILVSGEEAQNNYDLPENIDPDSISTAYKIKLPSLIKYTRFTHPRVPPFDKIFDTKLLHDDYTIFDCGFLSTIFTALCRLYKDLGYKNKKVKMINLASSSANIFTATLDNIEIKIAIMPIRG